MSLEKERLERFTAVARGLEGNVSVIVTQVDPDAFASAIALAQLLGALAPPPRAVVRSYFCGPIAHPQNRAIVNKYDLRKRLTPIEELAPDRVGSSVLVDSSLGADGRLPRGLKLDPVIVLDHHRGSDLAEREGRFVWVEDVGATSTMVAELWQALEMDFQRDRQMVAVLLAVGIHTDTKGLITAAQRDRDAYAYVARYVTPRELQLLIDYDLPRSHYRDLLHALEHHEQRGPRLVASLGTVSPEDGDDLSTIADYFLRMEGVTLVAVWAIVGDSVRISARNLDLATPLDEFLKRRFGPKSGAKQTAAGTGEGGALIPLDLGLWRGENNRNEIEALVGARIKELIFRD